MNLTSHEHVRRMWQVLAGLLLGFSSSSAVAATIPPARELTAAELQRLTKVKAWRITYHQDFVQDGLAAGVGGFIPTDFQAVVELRTSTLQYTRSVDAHFLVSGTPGCSSCNADYSEPVQIHFASSLGENEVLDLSSCGPRQPDGSPTPGHQASSYTRVVGPADFTLTGSGGQMPGAMPGEPPSFPYGQFFLDYGSNPPRANAFFGTPDFTGTGTLTFAGCLQNFGPTPSLASDSVEMRFAFNGDPSVVESYGDTQVRIEPDGQFVIKGYADTVWSTQRCIAPFFVYCQGTDPELFGTMTETSHTTWEARPVTPGGGDLEVVSVEPVQSVFGAPMIAGKDTVVEADIGSTFSDPVSATVTLTMRQPALGLSFDFTEKVTVPANCPRKRYFFPHPRNQAMCADSEASGGFRALGLAPIAGSAFETIAHIGSDPPALDSDPTNNDAPPAGVAPVSVAVKQTFLSLGYTTLACASCGYGRVATAEYDEAILWSDRHTLGMFPLSPEGYDAERCIELGGADCEDDGNQDTCVFDAKGSLVDCPGIESDHKRSYGTIRLFVPLASRAVAMVPDGYFGFHHAPKGAVGHTSRLNPASILVAAIGPAGDATGFHDPTLPHELGHSFGFDELPIERVLGYWVGCEAFGFSSCLVPPSPLSLNMMLSPAPSQFEPPAVWIEPAVYAEILARTQEGRDPSSLMITGTWKKDGSVSIDSLYELPAATNDVDSNLVSTHSIDLVDDAGRVIASNPYGDDFRQEFKIVGGDGPSIYPTSQGPIMATIAYPLETAKVQFKNAGKVMLEIDPLSGTLRQAIEAIPDRGYLKNPTERRGALLNKVDAFEKQLGSEALQGADQRLVTDIRKSVEDWVVDYAGRVRELSKTKVLQTIDSIDARLKARLSASGKKKLK